MKKGTDHKLIFGDVGASNLLDMWDECQHKKIAEVEKVTGRKLQSYSPYMFSGFNDKNLEELYTSRKLLVLEQESLATIQRIYGDQINSKICDLAQPFSKYGLWNSGDEIVFRNAINLVRRSGGDISLLFSAMVYHLIPLSVCPEKVQSIGIGASIQYARGAIFLSVPNLGENNFKQLAINIAHELGHQALMVYQLIDTVVLNVSEMVYSGVRKCLRPAIQSFHAVFALLFMVKFLRDLQLNQPDEYAGYLEENHTELSRDLIVSIEAFNDVEFTDLGKTLFVEMRLIAPEIVSNG